MKWYVVDRDGKTKLVSASNPEAAIEAVGVSGEVAVYAAEYIGRYDVRLRLTSVLLPRPQSVGTIIDHADEVRTP